MSNSESNKQVAGSHTPGRLYVKGERIYEEGAAGIDCIASMQVSNQPYWDADARRLAACWNACDGISTEYLETTGLPEFAGKTLCADIAQDELDKVERQRDQLATKVADTELALFAENQKRQDVERQKNMLFSIANSVAKLGLHVMPRGEPECICSHCELIREARDAIAAVKGDTV